jgi:hypothetical protein
MRRVKFATALGVLGAMAFLGVVDGAAAAQRPPRSAALDGVWSNLSETPLERPAEFDGLTTSDAHAAAYVAGVLKQDDDLGEGVGKSEWLAHGGGMTRIGGKARTSLIVAPADGRLPFSEAGKALVQDAMKNRLTRTEGPEVRPPPERCLKAGWGANAVPMLPAGDNGGYRIVQGGDTIAIWTASGREPRIIRIGRQVHLADFIRPWMGDSIGHWEGRTLVVETTNRNPGESFISPRPMYISSEAKVVERFTRLSAGEILYAFTVTDPTTYTRPWQGEEIWRALKAPLFEFACHEGNYAAANILAGARAEERAAK